MEINEDEEVESLLADKRHKELERLLLKLTDVISKKENIDLTKAIEKQVIAIKKLSTTLEEPNNTDIQYSIEGMTEQLKEIVNLLNSKKHYKFKINRDSNGFTEIIEVTQK